MTIGKPAAWQYLVTWIGVSYFIAVTAFICPGMQTGTQRYGPHFVFDNPMSQIYSLEPAEDEMGIAMPVDMPMDMGSMDMHMAMDMDMMNMPVHSQYSRHQMYAPPPSPQSLMSGPLVASLGAGIPTAMAGFMLTLDTFLVNEIKSPNISGLRSWVHYFDSRMPSPIWLPLPKKPPILSLP